MLRYSAGQVATSHLLIIEVLQETNNMTSASPPALIVAGTINMLSRTRYGFTSRNVPMYVFHPLDGGTPMRVACSMDPKENVVALVKPEAATMVGGDPIVGMAVLPRAHLVQVLGPSGDKAAELAALQWLACPFDPYPDPHSHRGAWVAAAIEEASQLRLTAAAGRIALDWPVTFNIDDASTRDIDDCCSIRRSATGWEFAITIADVASCVPAGSALDDTAFRAGQTLYLDSRAVLPMLPRALSEGHCSLLPGEPRLGLSLFFSWVDGAPDVGAVEWKPVVITSARSFSYEGVRADALACGWGAEIGALSAVSSILGKQMGLRFESDTTDPHAWIEAIMLFYNVAAGEALKRKGVGLLRRHAAPDASRLQRLSRLLGGELRFLAMSGASYCPASEAETQHWGLSAAAYAHASSPLRRYSDLHNQRVLLGLPTRLDAAAAIGVHLDSRALALKRFERDAFFSSAITPNSLTRTTAVFLHVLEEDEGEGATDEWATGEATAAAAAGDAAATALDASSSQKQQYRGRPQSRAEFWVVAWKRVLRLKVTVLEKLPSGAVTILSKDETITYSLVPGGACDILAYCDLKAATGDLRRRLKITLQPNAEDTRPVPGSGIVVAPSSQQQYAQQR